MVLLVVTRSSALNETNVNDTTLRSWTDESGPYWNKYRRLTAAIARHSELQLSTRRLQVMTWAIVVFVSRCGTWIVAQECDAWIIFELIDDKESVQICDEIRGRWDAKRW